MAEDTRAADTGADVDRPAVRKIGVADLFEALARGVNDFKRVPTHLIFLILIYPIVMLILARVASGYEMLPLVFPLLAGYTLVGPLVAVGMYELSRRLDNGLDASRMHLFDVLKSPSLFGIVTLGLVLAVIYFAWLLAALAIYRWSFGSPSTGSIVQYFLQIIALDFGSAAPASIGEFASKVFTTPAGWTLIVVGSAVGLVFAVVVLTISAVSFPMLLDRDVSAWTAAVTSVRAVVANPVTMAVWGLIVAASLVIGALPIFVGLAIVMPVLGHATWHVYRMVVE